MMMATTTSSPFSGIPWAGVVVVVAVTVALFSSIVGMVLTMRYRIRERRALRLLIEAAPADDAFDARLEQL
jgi:ribose/xylose/arabinose/galactoside ABC-type transport system permease subunit